MVRIKEETPKQQEKKKRKGTTRRKCLKRRAGSGLLRDLGEEGKVKEVGGELW